LIVHWDGVERYRAERGPTAATWCDLGRAAGSVGIGVKRRALIARLEHLDYFDGED
jgi:hypothetical protein